MGIRASSALQSVKRIVHVVSNTAQCQWDDSNSSQLGESLTLPHQIREASLLNGSSSCGLCVVCVVAGQAVARHMTCNALRSMVYCYTHHPRLQRVRTSRLPQT